jgi:NACalpha-BTF3-like transcription factor
MAEPIASSSAAADAADEENQPVANNAEDRKAAAALNNLNTQEISQDGDGTMKQRSAADQEALSKAISQLEIASGGGKKTEATKKVEAKKKEEAEVKKKIKVSQEDVTFLVDELDLSKVKATELLRSYEGDATKAIKAFIAPQVKV